MFVQFLMAASESPAAAECSRLAHALDDEVRRLAVLWDVWHSSPLLIDDAKHTSHGRGDASRRLADAHARSLVEDLASLQKLVTGEARALVEAQALVLTSQRQQRLVFDPVMAASAAAGAGARRRGSWADDDAPRRAAARPTALDFQRLYLRSVERRTAKLRVSSLSLLLKWLYAARAAASPASGDGCAHHVRAGVPFAYTSTRLTATARLHVRVRHPQITPQAIAIRHRHLSCAGSHILGHAVSYNDGVGAATSTVRVKRGASEDDRVPTAFVTSMLADRIDMTSLDAAERALPFELEVVSVRVGAPSRVAETHMLDYVAHRELALSPHFVDAMGSEGPTPGSACVTYTYESAQGVSLAYLVAQHGGLCETQPLFRHWARQILAALKDLDEQCTVLLSRPLTLANMFAADRGSRIIVGRVPWSGQVLPGQIDATRLLAARSRLLVGSYGTILASLLASEMDDDLRPRGSSSARGVPSAMSARVFLHEAAARGVNVLDGRPFELRLRTDAARGYVWDPPTVIEDDAADLGAADDVVDREGLDAGGAPETRAAPASSDEGGERAPKSLLRPVVRVLGVNWEDSGAGGATSGAVSRHGGADSDRHGSGAPPGATDADAVFARVKLVASRVGTCHLLLYHRLPWEALPARPTLVVQVSVHSAHASPVVCAIVRACGHEQLRALSPALAKQLPPLSATALSRHPYYEADVDATSVCEDYDGAFAS